MAMNFLSEKIGFSRARALVNWIRDHKAGATAGLTFTVSVSLALFFGLSGLREPTPRLDYEVLKEIDVLDVRTPVEQLSVTFQGEDIQRGNLNLRIYAMRVTNTGGVDILKSQFDEDIPWGVRVADGRVIEARLIESSSQYLNTTVNPVIIEEQLVEFPKAILEVGQFFAFNMLVLHGKEHSPVITPTGKIAGIESIGITKIPVSVDGPGFSASLFAGGWAVQLVRVIISLIGSAVVFLVVALAALLYLSMREKLRLRRIQNSVVVRGLRNQEQRDMLTNLYMREGPVGIRALQLGVNNPISMAKKEAEANAVAAAAQNGNHNDDAAAPTVESLEAMGVLSRDGDDGLVVDPTFAQSLDLLVLDLGSGGRLLI